ncbi:MAG: GntR family transcriptional regulator [Pyrinomonadaceae bacterium]
MKIWLSKNSEVPIYEQITAQIILGVASGDLAVGQKLPGTREIARRYNIHANTVSNAYRKLADEGWLEFRKGSGFYVREAKTETIENSLDRLIAEFFQTAQKQGYSINEIKTRLTHFLESDNVNQILLIESNEDYRLILAEEIRSATNRKVSLASFEDFQKNTVEKNCIFAAMFDETEKVKSVLPTDKNCIFLKVRSVADSMKDQQRPSENDLIAIVSGWEKFLLLAKTMLVAAQIDAESLIVRNTKDDDWQNGLSAASMIICDALTAKKLPKLQNIRPFYLIADESLEQLKQSV